LRRIILAFATRTPSTLIGFCFGVAFFTFPAVGIIGRTGVAIIEARSIGCVLIGPAVDLSFGMVDNSLRPNSFKGADQSPRELLLVQPSRAPGQPLPVMLPNRSVPAHGRVCVADDGPFC
jgi:hypothetical protein